jgi:adenylate cyclase
MAQLRDLVRREPRPGVKLPDWLERLIATGIVTSDPEVARRQRFCNVAAFVAAADALIHLVTNALYNFDGLMVIHIYNVLIAAGALATTRLHRFGDNVAAIVLILLLTVGNTFVVLALGITSDLQIYFTAAGAMLFLFGVQNWRLFVVFFMPVAVLLVLFLNFAPVDGFVLPTDGHLRDLLSTNAYLSTLLINAALIFYALTALRGAEVALAEQHERSEVLLSALLPPSIADRLKSGARDRVADRIDNLSVMFADLVGFTEASHHQPPDRVVAYLDELVRGFEALCEEHGADKIKSIGDGCMAVAGLEGDPRMGALAIGELALEMVARNAARPPLGNHKLGLRVGLHCGPAMAGVIGGTRFSYDVWGNAVNVAARMESTGETDRIQVTEAFRQLAGDAFIYEPRGVTDIKGLGAVETYWLVGARPPA